jgi:hypothetical protein
VPPLMRCTLARVKQTPLHYLERTGCEVDENEARPIFWYQQGAVLVDGKLAGGLGVPIVVSHGCVRVAQPRRAGLESPTPQGTNS